MALNCKTIYIIFLLILVNRPISFYLRPLFDYKFIGHDLELKQKPDTRLTAYQGSWSNIL